MAVKKTKKKSIETESKDDLTEQGGDEILKNSEKEETIPAKKTAKSKVEITEPEKPIIYKTYEADTEFKLHEIISKDNKILIGPSRLTRFEKARITGARSLQLSLGAPILTKIPPELTDTIMIAKFELEKKTLPISIRRILPNGLYQDIPLDWTIV